MPRRKMEENMQANIEIGDTNIPMIEVVDMAPVAETPAKTKDTGVDAGRPLVNCLRKERVIVRHIPRQSGIWGNNPKHVLSGGMADRAIRTFTVPMFASGKYASVLSGDEMRYLEHVMGLESGALRPYGRENSFWDDSNEYGISRVTLSKQDNYLDLSDPEDYIRYKILLANKDYIAPSLHALQDYPKATYQFVIIEDGEETKVAKNNMSYTMQCYKEYGKVEDNADILRVIIETIDGRPTAQTSKIEFLQTRVNELIQTDSKLFLKVITDPLLNTKVLIKKAIEAGLISNRGGFLYLRSDNTPLCEDGEEPVMNIAAKYLSSPKRQEMKFTLEARIKNP